MEFRQIWRENTAVGRAHHDPVPETNEPMSYQISNYLEPIQLDQG